MDADFLNDTKVVEIAKAAKEYNIPIIRANKKLVASVNGEQHNPFPLVFNPGWSKEQSQGKARRFNHLRLWAFEGQRMKTILPL